MAGPMEPLKGEETFNAPPAKVFAALTDLDDLAKNIPDLQSATKVDDRTLQCVVKPGFSFIRGTMKSKIHVAEAVQNEKIRITVTATGIGMGMEIESRLKLEPLEDGAKTRLIWEAQVMNRTGLVSAVPAGLIAGAADKTVKDGWEKLRARVEG
ncbi:MAG TPA: SRPBCC domain-containing protein [Tepidisphaeraceae bacterium]|nr:SRPBCC domain-containing protein [Tepidisphaeraceae bacterium]